MPKRQKKRIYWKSMVTNVFLDTNVVMDLFDAQRVAHASSLQAVKGFLESGATLYVNSDTLATSFYLLRSLKKATFEESLFALRETTAICELVSIEIKDVDRALSLCEDKMSPYKDYEDAMQYICAKKVNADVIITNDQNFVSKDIEIVRTL